MIGVIVLILIVLAVLYFLSVNNKLNSASLTDSSPSVADSSDSVQMDPQTGQYSVKLNNPKIKSLRVSYDSNGNKITKLYVAERPLSYNDVIDEGNRSVGANCVFLGTLLDNTAPGTSGASATNVVTRTTANFDVKQYKNIFIVFKNLDSQKTKENGGVCRYECEGMTYLLIDSSITSVPEIRDISYPVTVYTTNTLVQQKLIEYNYVQINDGGTLFLKNHKSFRLQ
ncbi:Odv-e25 [Ectropis obliqua nucleopolyhedrovirus]|uniref:Occlusion-derived virus envelope protein E25 n=1 Tax=Ectropis obliqua nucleopolyhedrovirus TaxID=59376 RepID=A0EYX6_9ABAC|nr:Odv-e25 [Ectropis obliqua nucleopolyhedrovirus]ABI35756.1 Odv-e25 [Ectropis obliqua nucleopolyhedrovirus]ADG21233.1 ODV-e25 [Ectropis obliqua nucleopolyhedrovirus]AGS47927.1 occlusion-derived virus envelope protein E25 [Ectropis obliqua nucleopolyhedrovirus]QWV59658.1 Odv-e25 [Ectropis obliqua nucleopolyhedrovirus]UYO72871.1 Odv-e25 [Ectropis obliqua nucleopolyhedrovirus]